MSSPHRPLDRRSGLVLDTHELGRRAGAMKLVRTTAPAPADLGIAVIGVPPGSPVELDLRLESVIEGVLVTGTATVQVRGECVRCLGEVSDELEVDIQELFVYPGSDATEDEASRLEGDLIDLEPLLRDGVVLDLPFQPLCREDCQGLCAVCGANLNLDPEHSHEAPLDPRWEKLRRLEGDDGGSYDVVSKSQA
ncbi:MAG: YceD family protein [Friedmanniella sp.]